jgi:hypothetical protein
VNLKRVLHNNGTGPQSALQFVFGHKFTGRPDQNFHKFEGPPADGYGRAVNAKLTAFEVDLALAGRVSRSNAVWGHTNGRDHG